LLLGDADGLLVLGDQLAARFAPGLIVRIGRERAFDIALDKPSG